jgi:hypothetical protein
MEAKMPSEIRLMDQLKQAIRLRHYSYRTEQAYVMWVRQYIYFRKLQHPQNLGEAGVTAFLSHLALHRKVAPNTQNQARNALCFLYRHVLSNPLGEMRSVARQGKFRNCR